MKNILYLITDLEIGGTEKVVYRIARELNKREFNPIVVALAGEGPIGKDIEALGVKVFCFKMKCWCDVTAIIKLARILKERKIDILHSFLFHANMLGKICGFIANTPLVISSYRCLDGVGEGRSFYLSCERILGSLSDKVICVSDAVKAHVHKHAGTPSDKLITIYNGVEISNEKGDIRKELGMGNKDNIVVSLSRLTHTKAIDELLLAAKIVIKKLPYTYFIIVGDGEEKVKLEKLSEDLYVFPNVIFTGWRQDINKVLNTADVFAHPSRMGEGIPNAILEAMACGKAVVATDIGGTKEIVVENETGYLVKLSDYNTFANRIISLIEDNKLRSKMGEDGLKSVREKFTIENMVKTYQSLYSNLLK